MQKKNKAASLEYKQGLPNGVFKAFQEKKLIITGEYKYGKRNGTWEFLSPESCNEDKEYSTGQYAHYTEGLRHGEWKSYRVSKNFKLKNVVNTEKLPLISSCHFLHGALEGQIDLKFYFIDKHLPMQREESFCIKDSLLNGLYIERTYQTIEAPPYSSIVGEKTILYTAGIVEQEFLIQHEADGFTLSNNISQMHQGDHIYIFYSDRTDTIISNDSIFEFKTTDLRQSYKIKVLNNKLQFSSYWYVHGTTDFSNYDYHFFPQINELTMINDSVFDYKYFQDGKLKKQLRFTRKKKTDFEIYYLEEHIVDADFTGTRNVSTGGGINNRHAEVMAYIRKEFPELFFRSFYQNDVRKLAEKINDWH
ncbi:MAG: hypothetical protein ACKOXB_07880 [Flavobacteriales bacterium]